jgi:hypothetical protein
VPGAWPWGGNVIHISHGLGTVAAVKQQVHFRRSPEKALPQITAKQTQSLYFRRIPQTPGLAISRKARSIIGLRQSVCRKTCCHFSTRWPSGCMGTQPKRGQRPSKRIPPTAGFLHFGRSHTERGNLLPRLVSVLATSGRVRGSRPGRMPSIRHAQSLRMLSY